MTPISFKCANCGELYTSKSHVFKTAEKQMHRAGWVTRYVDHTTNIVGRFGRADRLCLKCQPVDHVKKFYSL